MTAVVDTTTGEIVTACSEAEAREITEAIKNAAESIWTLLLEAHERRAWKALGYTTWDHYVRAEFDMSRRHANRLIGQAEVIRAIEAEVGPDGPTLEISEAAARDIKPHLDEVKADIATAVAALPDPTPEAVAETVRVSVSRKREQIREAKTEPAMPSVGDVIGEARNSPSYVGGKAVEQLHAIRKFITDKAGGPSAIVADLDGESGQQLAELWLPTIDATCDLLDDWRQRLRRRHLRGVK
jgi:hypothetical protein